jgi:hypothetical protein
MVAEKKKEYLRVVIRIWNRNKCIVGRLRESQGDVAYDMDEVVVEEEDIVDDDNDNDNDNDDDIG